MADSIDETIRELFSPRVLEEFHGVMSGKYDVSRDELPYRLETAYKVLTNVFGMKGAETISRMITRRLYRRLDLEFDGAVGLTLLDYVEIAKKKLAQSGRSDPPCT